MPWSRRPGPPPALGPDTCVETLNLLSEHGDASSICKENEICVNTTMTISYLVYANFKKEVKRTMKGQGDTLRGRYFFRDNVMDVVEENKQKQRRSSSLCSVSP